jgi:hypothetical protein
MVAKDRWDQRNYSNYSQETLNLYCARGILGGVPGHKYRRLPLGFSINILPTLQYTNPTIILSELLKALILNSQIMKLHLILTSALLAATGLSCSTHGKRNCEWFGDAPFCGSTNANLGDKVGGWTLIDWTKDKSSGTFCTGEEKEGPIRRGDQHCCETYGEVCWSGYKRLWCKDA